MTARRFHLTNELRGCLQLFEAFGTLGSATQVLAAAQHVKLDNGVRLHFEATKKQVIAFAALLLDAVEHAREAEKEPGALEGARLAETEPAPPDDEPTVCGEKHPILCEDEDGEIPLRCGLARGHAGEHQDRRTADSVTVFAINAAAVADGGQSVAVSNLGHGCYRVDCLGLDADQREALRERLVAKFGVNVVVEERTP